MTRQRIATAAFIALSIASCTESSGPSAQFTVIPDTSTVLVGGAAQFTAMGAPGSVQWSSSDTDIASVVPQTGFATGVAPGIAQIMAASDGNSASATLTVLAPPSLDVSEPSIEFERVTTGVAAASRSIIVSNAGSGAIDNVTVGAAVYGVGEPVGWLSASSNGTTTPVTVTLAVDSLMPRGTYTATVPFSAAGVVNSPQHVAVTYRVRAPAGIAVTRSSVPMAGIPDVVVEETVGITNAGDLPLTGLSTSIDYTPGGQADWLTANLSSTDAPATLTLQANTAALTTGNYSATVEISSSIAGATPVALDVTLIVSPGPAIQLNPNIVDVNAIYANDPAQQNVSVENSGGGSLSGLSLGSIVYGAGQTAGWLAGSLNTTTAPATITLAFTTASLASGDYTATVPVQSAAASNSPASLIVNLTVGPPPSISLNPTSVQFAGFAGGTSIPSAQVVQVTNGGGGTLNGLDYGIAYTSGNGWLDASLNTTTAPAMLELRPNTTALAGGTYTADVTVTSTVPGVASSTMTVTYTMQTFTVDVFPFFAGCSGCHVTLQPAIPTGTTAAQYYSNLGPFIIPGDAAGSRVVCKLFAPDVAPCTHVGGKRNGVPGFQAIVEAWINAGAPFR